VYIVNRAGTAFTASYSVAEAGALTEASPAATAASATIGAAVRPGDRFTATVAIGPASASVTYTARAGDTATKVAAALAALLNNSSDPDAEAYSAVARDGTLFIVNRDGSAFTPAYGYVQVSAGTIGESVAKPVTLQVNASTVVSGENWVLELISGSTVSTYSVTAGASLQDILAHLADAVNADAGSPYAADVVAGAIRLFRSGDAAFSATLSVSPAGVPAIDAATARTTLVSLVGNPVVGEVWTLSFGGQSYAVTVTGAMASLADVAQGLAALVNADNTHAAMYTASHEDKVLLITNREGTVFSAAVAVTPALPRTTGATPTVARVDLSGFPLAGEEWTVTLGGHDYTVVVGGSVNSLGEIASALAGVIRADATYDRYTAVAEGSALMILDLAAGAIAPLTAIKPVSGHTVNAAPPAFIGIFDSTPTTGHTWRVTLTDAGGVDHIFNLVIGAYDTDPGVDTDRDTVEEMQALVASGFAGLINAGGPAMLSAVAEGNQLAIVARDGSTWTASFSISATPGTLQAGAVADSLGATTVTLAGQPHPREIWTLTVGATPTFVGNRLSLSIGETYTLGTGPASVQVLADTLDALATIFGNWINGVPVNGVATPALAGYHAVVSNNALVIVKRSGTGFASFDTSVRFTPAVDGTADLYDVVVAAGGARSIELVGSPVAGEKWTVTLTPASGSPLAFSYYALRDDTLAGIAQALADAVNTSAGAVTAGYVASVEGGRLVLVNTAGNFSAAIAVLPADDRSGAAASGNHQLVADTTAPYAWSATLSGAATAGEIWKITLGGHDYLHTVLPGETTADIAAALAESINTAVSPDFAAIADDRTLIIVDRLRTASAPVYQIGGAANARFAATGSTLHAATAAVTLSGTPVAGETYTVLLRIGVAATQYGYVVQLVDADNNPATPMTAESLSAVTAGLAAAINVNAPDDFIALTDGARLFVVHRAGTGFKLANGTATDTVVTGTATVVNLAASTLFAGEVWTVILDDSTFSTTHTHVVRAGETLADVARELAKSIVAGGIVTFTATSKDSRPPWM
jgi:hypothetical protein